MEKLFYKGNPIKQEDAHKLSTEEKAFLTKRKPTLLKTKGAKK